MICFTRILADGGEAVAISWNYLPNISEQRRVNDEH